STRWVRATREPTLREPENPVCRSLGRVISSAPHPQQSRAVGGATAGDESLPMEIETPPYSLANPLAVAPPVRRSESSHPSAAFYEESVERGRELLERSKRGGGLARVRVQHAKNRMTVFERLKVLTRVEPNLMWQNWGKGLDGASIVTGILSIAGRDVAVYG